MEQEHFTKLANTEQRINSLCSVLEKNQIRWLSFIKQVNSMGLASLNESQTARQVLEQWKNDNRITTSKLMEILSKINHKRAIQLIKSWIRESAAKELYDQGLALYWKSQNHNSKPYFQKSADMNYPPAFLRLYKSYKPEGAEPTTEENNRLAEQYKKNCLAHKDWFLEKANTGDPAFQYTMGLFYGDVEEDHQSELMWYHRAADQNYGPAQNCIGSCYMLGEGVPKDLNLQYEWYTRAAENGFLTSIHNLGVCHRDGEGVLQNSKEAAKWFLKAAELGYVWSMVEYSTLLSDEERWEESLQWLSKAAEFNDADAIFNLGWYHSVGKYVPQDYTKAAELFLRAVNMGNDQAQYFLGYHYSEGQGVPQDWNKSIHWYTKAAEQKNADAIGDLGWCYLNGIGVKQDVQRGLEYFRQAADMENSHAIYNLAMCYFDETGVEKDDNKGLHLLLKAANLNNTDAMLKIGLAYLEGNHGAQQNTSSGLSWLKKAAQHENSVAQVELGRHYAKTENYTEAYKWFEMVAQQEDSRGQYYLGYLFYSGYGVRQNYETAVEWFQKSYEQENEDTVISLAKCFFYGEGVPQNIPRALDMLREWGQEYDLELLESVTTIEKASKEEDEEVDDE